MGPLGSKASADAPRLVRAWTFGELYGLLPNDLPRRSLLRVEAELARPGGPWLEEVASAMEALGRELPIRMRRSLLHLLEVQRAPPPVRALAARWLA